MNLFYLLVFIQIKTVYGIIANAKSHETDVEKRQVDSQQLQQKVYIIKPHKHQPSPNSVNATSEAEDE
jgi:hypothetical protein